MRSGNSNQKKKTRFACTPLAGAAPWSVPTQQTVYVVAPTLQLLRSSLTRCTPVCTPVCKGSAHRFCFGQKKNRCASVQSVCPIRIVHSDARSKVRTCDWRSRGVPTPTELWNGIGTFHLSTPRARHPHQHVLPETGVHPGVHTGVQTGVHLVRLLLRSIHFYMTGHSSSFNSNWM